MDADPVDSDDDRPKHLAPQHGPRPLPLFLDMLRDETAGDPDRRAAALKGLRLYQEAERPAPLPSLPAAGAAGGASLRRAGGDGPPVVFVPSLINPPSILDLDGDRSLLRHVAAQGFAAWLVDWGAPGPDDRVLDIGGHVERRLLPLLDGLDHPPLLVGYCLGGTMALAAAARGRVAGVATIAAPWRYSGYGDAARAVMAELWAAAEPACASLGLVPTEVLQAGFWRLDPARTVAKYEAFGRMDPASAGARAFVRLEDWANAGAPLTYAAGAQLFERFVGADDPGLGRWAVGGAPVDLAALPCPAIEFVSTSDRIVPAATAAGLPHRVALGAGHVGMVVGSGRDALWTPLVDWLRATAQAQTRS